MKTKNEYIDSLATELKDVSAKIDVMSAKTEKTVGMAKLKYTQELNSLRGHQQAATVKMRELEEASDEAWEKVKETANVVWKDLRVGLASASAKFN